MKNQCIIKKLFDPISIGETCSWIYVDNKTNEPSNKKNTSHVDFNDKNLKSVRFIKVNSSSAIPEHLVAKFYVNRAISDGLHELSLLELDRDEE